MTKPDRWTRVVKRAVERSAPPRTWEKAIGYHLRDNEVIPLLRAEHRATIRAVNKFIRARGHSYMKEAGDMTLTQSMRNNSARKAWAMKDLADDLLAYLKERAK